MPSVLSPAARPRGTRRYADDAPGPTNAEKAKPIKEQATGCHVIDGVTAAVGETMEVTIYVSTTRASSAPRS